MQLNKWEIETMSETSSEKMLNAKKRGRLDSYLVCESYENGNIIMIETEISNKSERIHIHQFCSELKEMLIGSYGFTLTWNLYSFLTCGCFRCAKCSFENQLFSFHICSPTKTAQATELQSHLSDLSAYQLFGFFKETGLSSPFEHIEP